jgi:hypothetical protein
MSAPANNYEASVRWQPVFNVGSTYIPACAAMMLAGYGDRPANGSGSATDAATAETPYGTYGWGARLNDDGQMFFMVDKPNERVYVDQASTVIWFNGPQAIAPQQWGAGTQDFPCVGIHDARRNVVHPNTPLTVVPDEWYLIAGGSMFSALGHWRGTPVIPTTRPWEHAMVIGPPRPRRLPALHNHGQDLGATVPALNYFCPTTTALGRTSSAAVNEGFNGVQLISQAGVSLANADYFIRSQSPYFRTRRGGGGTYLLSFSGTAWYDQEIARNTTLLLAIEVYWPTLDSNGETVLLSNGEPAGYSQTPVQRFYVVRTQQIESDYAYGISNIVAKENMALAVPTYLPDFAIVVMRNLNNHTVELLYPMLGVALLGQAQYWQPAYTFDGGWTDP